MAPSKNPARTEPADTFTGILAFAQSVECIGENSKVSEIVVRSRRSRR